jgi:hypothetical protein
MAVANTKSTHVTNADANPLALTNSYIAKGQIYEVVGTVETLAADDASSVYRMARVPSNARITSILLGTDAISGATTSDIGVYQTAANGGAIVGTGDQFATDVNLSAAATVFTEDLLEATATDIAKVEYRLWEMLALTVDPMRYYDICVTVNDVTAAGTISMKLKYVV